VLVFLSLLERRAVVLGDSGINARVADGEWSRIVGDLARGMGAGRPADALVGAIDACGDLLDRAGLERREDDRDELSNSIHLEGLEGLDGPGGPDGGEERS
jgi:putative membrane protein